VNTLRAVWDVLVDLIVGDDPKIAVAVVVSLVVAGIALALGASATLVTVGGAVVVLAAFTVTMWRDTR
jgi:uncharacterized membrane protein YphA (DoxX/SURF4 family)